jgi:hypothetical protein
MARKRAQPSTRRRSTTTTALQTTVAQDVAPIPPPAPTNEQRRDVLRTLSALNERIQFATQHGFGYEGKRDYYTALGYTRTLTPELYWERYRRNGVARRLVNALPNATWRSGADLVEDDSPEVVTPFEQAWVTLAARTNVWDRMRKADILAQLGQFSVLLLGLPGSMESEPKRTTKPDALSYIKQFSQLRVKFSDSDLETNSHDPRFGKPRRYQFVNLLKTGGTTGNQYVHWMRVIHVADEAVEDDMIGEPLLAAVWNWLDDLEKVAGSGSEAFWRRVQPLLAATLQAGALLQPGAEAAVEEEIDKLVHGLRRWVRLSGIELDEVGTTDVAQFDKQIDALIGLIVTPYGIPKRIFQGSEQGQLASGQDVNNWTQNIRDRRRQFAEAQVLRPLVQRLVDLGIQPAAKEGYEARWPDVSDLGIASKLDLAKTAAETNKAQGEMVMTTNEIRDQLLGLEPLEDDELRAIEPATEAQLMARLRASKRRGPLQLIVQRDDRGRASGLVLDRRSELDPESAER